jgi:hypothetical protein
VGHLCTNTDDCRGVIGDVFIIEGEAGGTYEFGVAMFGFVLGGLLEDGREGVDSIQLIVWNDHEEGEKRFSDGKQVVVSWFPFERGKCVICLFEEAGDSLWSHCVGNYLQTRRIRNLLTNYGNSFLGQRSWASAV